MPGAVPVMRPWATMLRDRLAARPAARPAAMRRPVARTPDRSGRMAPISATLPNPMGAKPEVASRAIPAVSGVSAARRSMLSRAIERGVSATASSLKTRVSANGCLLKAQRHGHSMRACPA